MAMFTVFCRSKDDYKRPSIHISAHEADNENDAAVLGRAETAGDWQMKECQIDVIGIAEGDVNILQWDDESGVDLPAPQELTRIRIEVNAFSGCNFTGCKVFEIEADAFEDQVVFSEAFGELADLLEDVEVDDDPMGEMLEQIRSKALDILIEDENGEATRKDLVLNAGRYALDADGDVVYERGEKKLDETFDITVYVVPVYEEQTDEEE